MIVEDGTGLPDAVSYVSVEELDEHHRIRGRSSWATLTLDQKESAAIRATDHIDADPEYRFSGGKLRDSQSLQYPRAGVSPWRPKPLLQAVCELALIASKGELIVKTEPQLISKTTGPISRTWAQTRSTRPYPQIDAILRPILSGNSGTIQLVRG